MLGNGDAVTMSRVLMLLSLFLPCSTLSPRVQRRRVVTKMGMEGLDTTELLAENAAAIAAVGSKTGLGGGNEGPYDDLWLLRYVLAAKGDADAAAAEVEATLSWRRGEGKAIVDAAASGLEAARAGGGWDNGALFSAAPHSAAIAPHISPDGSQILTLRAKPGYLVKVIRASAIDDKALMSTVTTEQLVDFFLFSYEANALVIDAATRESGKLITAVTVNDLSGIDLFGDATFRNALSAASKQANAVGYSGYNSATILVNLPKLLGALVKLFKPLFPKTVQKKLKFEQGPLSDVTDLRDLIPPGAAKENFLSQVDDLLG